MEDQNIDVIVRPEDKSRQVLQLLMEPCWDLFYCCLSNEDIGRIDSALTEKGLRKLYLDKVGEFYIENNILSAAELKWIMKRDISLTVCRLDFEYEGKASIWLHTEQYMSHNNYNLDVF